ncbi:unnamed protein product [Vitrella brassicaformis CCMP3155]|uniref:Uncharacterized protein n=1 Tax=Vitrella brassicaformis (strain CCMP3155) TaxID=1169540 RepID=A0A0G4EGI7_VITBC|nr:unnamed protein product [Vitrella brassicaformis CCMP3155]|eukprot:CEL94585.1 unnamed protein product [Vitrella brassicaformis CCMP3155]
MAATSLSSVVPYALPYVDGRDLFILDTVCKDLKALVDPDPSSAIWRLQYHRSFGKRGKGNVRLISSSAHFPRESVRNPSAYVPLPEGDYRRAYRRSRVVEDFGANAEVSQLRWGQAKCVKPRNSMKRSRSSIFIAGPSLYVFGGVVGGKREKPSFKTDLWRVSLASLVPGGKYEWQRCHVDGVAPRPSDALILIPVNIAPPPLNAPPTQPEWPKRYFVAGGRSGSDTDSLWGVLEINREEGVDSAKYRHQWLSKSELRGAEKKSTPPLNRRYFTCTFVPIRSSAHPKGYIFIFGGMDSTTGDGNVGGLRPTARLNHTATLVKDRYVFIIGGEEWDHEIDSDFDESDDEFDSGYGPSQHFDPVGFVSPPRLSIFDGESKTWIELSRLPWVAMGTFPLVDDALRSYLASVEGHRCDFARHTAVLAGDKIVIMVPYANYGGVGRYGGMKTLTFDITTGRFSKPAFATRPQKMSTAPPPPGMTPHPTPSRSYKPYEPPPAACAAAVWTGSELILYGGASLLDEEWDEGDPETHYDEDDYRHDQTKHSEISVLGVMDRATNDQTVPVDRHQQVMPFSRRYVWNRQLWQMDVIPPSRWDDHDLIEKRWYEGRQRARGARAAEREQLRQRGVEIECDGDEYDGMEGYTEKEIDDHLAGKPLPCNKVFGKPITPTRHQALSKFFPVTGILHSDPVHWTLPTGNSRAVTTPKITKYFKRVRGPKPPLVQSSLTDFFPFRTACRQTINHGYRS